MPRATARRRPRLAPDPEQRREDLLAAGAAVFAEVGVDAATVSAITARAGTAKGNFYRYFSSKDALLAALREQFINDLLDEVLSLSAPAGGGDWWLRVDALVAAMIDALLARRDRIAIFFTAPTTPEAMAFFSEGEAQIDAVISAGIQSGVEAGVFRVDDPPMTAMILQHAVFGTIEHHVRCGEPVDRDRLVAGASAIARRALGQPA